MPMLAEVEPIAPCPPLTSWHTPEMTKSAMKPRPDQVLLQSSAVMDCATPALVERKNGQLGVVNLDPGKRQEEEVGEPSLPEGGSLLVEDYSTVRSAIDDRSDL